MCLVTLTIYVHAGTIYSENLMSIKMQTWLLTTAGEVFYNAN